MISPRSINSKVSAIIRNLPRRDGGALGSLIPITTEGDLLTVVLSRPKDWRDALWAAYSNRWFLGIDSRILFLFDGAVPERGRLLIQRAFPRGSVDDVNRVASGLAVRHPCFDQFRDHKLVPKLLALLALQATQPILYLDSDVLTFTHPSELASIVTAPMRTGAILKDCGNWNQDAELMRRASAEGLRSWSDANSGLLYIPHGSLNVEIAAAICSDPLPMPHSLFVEQTLLSLMAANSCFEMLSPSNYVVDNTGMMVWERDLEYTDVIVRHFTGTVRHRLRMSGIPLLQRRLREAGRV